MNVKVPMRRASCCREQGEGGDWGEREGSGGLCRVSPRGVSPRVGGKQLFKKIENAVIL